MASALGVRVALVAMRQLPSELASRPERRNLSGRTATRSGPLV